MENDKTHVCPTCGTEMQKAKYDGTLKFNGKVNYSGYYCPNCSKQKDENESEN